MPESVDEADVDWIDKFDAQRTQPGIRVLTCSQQRHYIMLTVSPSGTDMLRFDDPSAAVPALQGIGRR